MPYFQQKFTFSTQSWIQQHPGQDPWERTYIRLALLCWVGTMSCECGKIQSKNPIVGKKSQDFCSLMDFT